MSLCRHARPNAPGLKMCFCIAATLVMHGGLSTGHFRTRKGQEQGILSVINWQLFHRFSPVHTRAHAASPQRQKGYLIQLPQCGKRCTLHETQFRRSELLISTRQLSFHVNIFDATTHNKENFHFSLFDHYLFCYMQT